MSSYGGVPIDVAAVGADYLVSSANKCIGGMAGLSFVICRRAALEALGAASDPRVPALIANAYDSGDVDMMLSAVFAKSLNVIIP